MENGEVTFTMDYAEVGLFLRTNLELRAYLEDLGRRGVAYARSIAPVGDRTTKTTHPGQYRDSLKSEVTVGGTRMSLRIYSDDYTAWWVEYGSKHNTRHAVLRRTLDFLKSGLDNSPLTYGGTATYDALNTGTSKSRTANRRARAVEAGLKGR